MWSYRISKELFRFCASYVLCIMQRTLRDVLFIGRGEETLIELLEKWSQRRLKPASESLRAKHWPREQFLLNICFSHSARKVRVINSRILPNKPPGLSNSNFYRKNWFSHLFINYCMMRTPQFYKEWNLNGRKIIRWHTKFRGTYEEIGA